MKRTVLITALFFTLRVACAQCAADYVGDYGVRSCSAPDTITSYLWNSEVVEITPSRILIRNFHGIPNSVIGGVEDTIFADLDCAKDSLYLETVSFPTPGLSYSGSGAMKGDTLTISYHQINPTGSQDICLVYLKGTLVVSSETKTNPASVKIYPNPASSRVSVEVEGKAPEAVELVGTDGRVFSIVPEKSGQIDISFLPSGVYLLRVHSVQGESLARRIVKY